MSSELVGIGGGALSRVPRQVAREVQAARVGGLIAGERIGAAAYAATVAVQHATWLSEAEQRVIEQVPLAEPRVKSLVDIFTGVAASELARLGMR